MLTRMLVLLLPVVGVLAQPLRAQVTWSPAGGGRGLDVRATKAVYDHGGPGFATFTLMPTVRFPASDRIDIEFELPFSRATVENAFDETTSGSIVGNPYVGIAATLSDVARIRAGLRLGVFADASDEGSVLAATTGVLSER